MSDSQPPPYDPANPAGSGEPQQPGQPSWGQPPTQPPADMAYFGPEGGASEPESGGGRRGLKVGIIAASLTLIAGGGAFAFYAADPLHLFRPGVQAASAVPSDAVFYAGMDIDPTAEQKINAIRFLNHFPAFKDEFDISSDADLREKLGKELIKEAPCDGLSYDSDIKPWLGTKLGIAVMPTKSGDDPFNEDGVVVVIETTDKDKASDGLDAIKDCAAEGGDDEDQFGYAFVDDFAVIAQSQSDASKYAADADDASLADEEDFKADMDSLGDLGVVSTWADVKSILDNVSAADITDLSPNEQRLLASSTGRFAATFRFNSDAAEIAASIYTTTDDVDTPSNQVTKLPDSTVFALSAAGGGKRLAAAWDDILDALSDQGIDVDSEIANLEDETGLKLPDDMETVLGDNLMFAIDGDGLTFDNLNQGNLGEINAGVRFTSDPDALGDVYEKVVDLVEAQIGHKITMSKVDTDDGLVLATNDDYANELAEGGSLGDSSDFKSVIDDASDADAVVYFDFNAVEDELAKALDAGNEDDLMDNFSVLRAFGISADQDGNYIKLSVKLSVDE